MSMEIRLLVWSVGLALLQALIAALGTVLTAGLLTGVGNRDDMPVLTGWAGRAHRAHRNMLESLLLFAPLILVAQAQDKFNAICINVISRERLRFLAAGRNHARGFHEGGLEEYK